MVLADAVEIRDLAIKVVEDLNLTRLLAEENLRPPGKRLDIRQVLRKYLDDLLCQTVFPTYVRKR